MRHIKEYVPAEVRIFVCSESETVPENYDACIFNKNIVFDLEALASYFFKDRNELAVDTFMLAAAVEYADYIKKRPARSGWIRDFHLSLPVSSPEKWNDDSVRQSLTQALNMLTGDSWTVSFRKREFNIPWPKQATLDLPSNVEAVIAFSEGMDSLAVGALSKEKLGDRLVQLRMGKTRGKKGDPFVAVPFKCKIPKNKQGKGESSGRSRGFKFAVLSIIASFLAGSSRIIVPESGQGAIGPALVTLSRIPPDYRNHPAFFQVMEKFAKALLNITISFEIPRLWNTKGQTLRKYKQDVAQDERWIDTVSCWRDSRVTSVNKKKVQCGICAACLLRRMSVHAAGLKEPENQYLWHDLSASKFEEGSRVPFTELGAKAKHLQYGKAGVRHFQDLADFSNEAVLNINAGKIARATGNTKSFVMGKQREMLAQHRIEWTNFLASLGPNSFISKWATGGGDDEN